MRTITIEVEKWFVVKYDGPDDDPWDAYEEGNFEDENTWSVLRECDSENEAWKVYWMYVHRDPDAPEGTYARYKTTEKVDVFPGDDRYDSYEEEVEWSWYHR